MYSFEFDNFKSNSNKIKHGIDFREAKLLWNDLNLIEIKARSIDEPRFLIIGKIELNFWSAVVTYRKDKIRIISVRKSRREEIDFYEKN